MEALSKKLVLALGIVAVITIGVNLTIFLAILPWSISASTSAVPQSSLESPELGLKRNFSPYLGSIQVEQGGKTISVTGIGIAKAKPERALISLSVITQADSAEEAISENAAKMDLVTKALKTMGIAEEQIETFAYSLTPLLDYSDRNSPKITGYTCSNTIRITTMNLNKIGDIIDNAVSAGANHVSSLQFTVSEERLRQLGLEALRNAVKDAESKAKAIASATGVTLTNLFSISVLSYSPNVANYSFESPIPAPTPIAGVLLTPILPPGEVSITVSISAVYEFR
ncbi:MAG: SIMPL domain-containing protein [Candidatus Brockarchaeota archaeon]|nr:SIMPL domain-containing protein [Candidatus Brockarchaeota archaeon]